MSTPCASDVAGSSPLACPGSTTCRAAGGPRAVHAGAGGRGQGAGLHPARRDRSAVVAVVERRSGQAGDHPRAGRGDLAGHRAPLTGRRCDQTLAARSWIFPRDPDFETKALAPRAPLDRADAAAWPTANLVQPTGARLLAEPAGDLLLNTAAAKSHNPQRLRRPRPTLRTHHRLSGPLQHGCDRA